MVVALRADAFLAGLGNLLMQGRCCRNFHLKPLCISLTLSI
jgi:hypothetical protein